MGKQAPSFDEIISGSHESKKRYKLRQILSRNNKCKIWIGGSENERVDYPYRLVPADKITSRVRNAATELMIDSAINDPSMTNAKVLEKAIEYSAQWVIPKDYQGEIDKTHESVLEFVELVEESNFGGNIMFPIQPPHDEHYKRYEEFYSQVSHLAVGGVKDADPQEQIQAVKDLREVAGPHKFIHGLGMGCSMEIMEEAANNPDFLDSMDTSTYERLPKYGKLADKEWKQRKVSLPGGENISSLNGIATELMVYQANYQLTPFVNGDDSEEINCENSVQSNEEQETQSKLSESWKKDKANPEEQPTNNTPTNVSSSKT